MEGSLKGFKEDEIWHDGASQKQEVLLCFRKRLPGRSTFFPSASSAKSVDQEAQQTAVGKAALWLRPQPDL